VCAGEGELVWRRKKQGNEVDNFGDPKCQTCSPIAGLNSGRVRLWVCARCGASVAWFGRAQRRRNATAGVLGRPMRGFKQDSAAFSSGSQSALQHAGSQRLQVKRERTEGKGSG